MGVGVHLTHVEEPSGLYRPYRIDRCRVTQIVGHQFSIARAVPSACDARTTPQLPV
ncbi:hypothetical protein MPLB_1420023 [Mesorhizobium sp. ORS 3324]|nr:hypothetical protein MPLB_1420023 [Mesorhizobium sp. ORS 3324]